MKQYGLIYDNFEKMKSFIYSNNINKSDTILIQVFTGIIRTEFIEKIIDEITSVLPQAEIIGATTSGEIFNERAISNNTVISFTIFEKTRIRAKLFDCISDEYTLGINIAEELIEEDTKALILFSEGLLLKGLDILKGIQSVNNKITVCGGKASDNGCLNETFVFTKEGITKKGVAAVSLTGKQLNITTDYSFGWSTIGKTMTVTKASDNRVYTIDNVKTADIYKKYLGDEVAKGLPMSATEFPLMVMKDGFQIANVPCTCNDDGSLSFLNKIEVNDKVKFGYGNVNILIDNSLEISDRLAEKNIEALFIYSCSVRRSFMGEKISLDINPLSTIAPAYGFFTYGEFYTMNNSNILLGVTMTVLGISEGEGNSPTYRPVIKNEVPAKNFFDGKDIGVIKAFTNLVDEATNELEQTNEILERQKRKIEKMNSITKSILQINSEMISSNQFEKFTQLLLDEILCVIEKGKMGSILIAENNKLCYKAAKGYIPENIKDIKYDVEKLKNYNISSIFNPAILKNADNHSFFKLGHYSSWKDLLIEQPKELLSSCIGIDGQIAGLINIFNTDCEDDFDEEDKVILKYICYVVAIALKNVRLLKNVIHMYRYDTLTGVYNRSYLREMLEKTLSKSKISRMPFVICGLDLNDFKIINDTYGHHKGDEALAEFAAAFKREIDTGDIIGRTGGDEFVASFPNKSKKQVIEIINRIHMNLSNISFSYGLSEFPGDSDSIDELLKIADRRMYERKRRIKK